MALNTATLLLMTQYAKSTYAVLIDAIRAEFGENADVTKINPDQIKAWILQAEEHITQRIDVREEWSLRYITDIPDYNVQDRPAVTGITTATPAVLSTGSAHGLSQDDIFYLTGVYGMTTPDGRMKASAVSATTITLKHYRRIVNATNATPIVVQFDEDHPFQTGDSIDVADVTGNDAANGTWTITKVNDRKVSLDTSVGNGQYAGSGSATKDVAGDGTYVSGGRFWKETEIPTYFKRFEYGTVLYGSVLYRVKVIDISNIDYTRSRYQYQYPFHYQYPVEMAMGRRNGIKYGTLFPLPQSDGTMTMHGVIGITPNDYINDDENSNIHLSTEYDPLIIAYVKGKIGFAYLKNPSLMQVFYDEMTRYQLEVTGNKTFGDKEIVYK